MADFLRFLLRFVVFVVRMWLALAWCLRTFPLPVSLKRFAAPRCVFSFGILLPLVSKLPAEAVQSVRISYNQIKHGKQDSLPLNPGKERKPRYVMIRYFLGDKTITILLPSSFGC
jgi:hydrogenase/urease accessory protein HupE